MVNSTSPPPRLRRPPPLSSLSRERFKGVRRRSWGRWVSEIRIPHSREKIWLGSYSTAEQAARAYDIASLLLRGSSSSTYLNFADSTALMSTDHRLAVLVAEGIASPRTIQAMASKAANSMVPTEGATGSNHDDGSSQDMEDDNCQQSSGTSAKDCDAAAQPHCTDQCMVEMKRAAAHTSMCNAMPDSCWIQDVLTLIISPKDRSSPPSLSSCSLQPSPSVARCASAPSPSSNIPTPILNSCHALPSSSKATSPDFLLQMLFDDFQYPLEGLVTDGFMAISPAVITRKRFDTETPSGVSCELVDSTQLWSHVH